MCKRDLLMSFYKGTETLDNFLTMAYSENIEVMCIVKTSIYEFMVSDNLCDRLNKLYKDMTCRNLNAGLLTYDEIRDKFDKIQTLVNFI